MPQRRRDILAGGVGSNESKSIDGGQEWSTQQWPDQIWIDQATGEEIVLPAQMDEYVFGNPDYPIALYRDLIVDTVGKNPVTILASGTGNGKSISVVQYLYESGQYRYVYQTQPRVVATRENERFTLQQMNEAAGRDMSDSIVYRTAVEGDVVKRHHAIREHTDGYLLQRLLVDGGEFTDNDVIIVDEAHMRNPNIDLAIAVALEKGVRLVIQSASIDTGRWAEYGSKVLGGRAVPVLDLPGVMHAVESKVGESLEQEIIKYAYLQPDVPLNIGTIVPGKREIGDVIGRITNKVPDGYTIVPLHAEQSAEDQRRAMASYPGGKIIVATEVLRQSVTVPDLDVMVDPLYARSGDYRQGIRYLRVHPVSMANVIQGSGRVGRTKPGLYVQANLAGYPEISRNEQNEPLLDSYDTPPILRTDIAPFVLRLGRAGLDILNLELQDIPRVGELEYAHRKLVRLGAQVLHSAETTRIGELMSSLPLDPSYARMFIESQKHSQRVEVQMAAIASIAQQDGITMTEKGYEKWRILTKENRSDMLVQLDVLVQALVMQSVDIKEYNIIDRRLKKSKRLFERLSQGRGYSIHDLRTPTEDERQELIECMIAGADKLFVEQGSGYTDGALFSGRLAKSTSVRQGSPLVIGSGLVIEHYRNGVKKSHSVITNATAVTPEQLVAYAPWRCTYGEGRLDMTSGSNFAGRELFFDNYPTGAVVRVSPSRETTEAVVVALMNGGEMVQRGELEKVDMIAQEAERIRDLLVHRSARSQEYAMFIEMLQRSVLAMKDIEVASVRELAEVMHRRGIYGILKNSYVAESEDMQNILRQSPDTAMMSIGGDLVEVGVEYRHNNAYIQVPVHRIREISDYGIVEQFGDRQVYVWVDQGKTQSIELGQAVAVSRQGNRQTRRSR